LVLLLRCMPKKPLLGAIPAADGRRKGRTVSDELPLRRRSALKGEFGGSGLVHA
jgi:hypothetical protein